MLTGTACELPFVAAVLTGTMHVCIHVPCTRLPGIAFSGIETNLQNKTQEASLPALLCISCSSYLVSVVFAGQRIACPWLRAPASRVMRLLLELEEVRCELSAKSTQKRRIQDLNHDLNSHNTTLDRLSVDLRSLRYPSLPTLCALMSSIFAS